MNKAFTTKFINSNLLPLVIEPTHNNMSAKDAFDLLESHREEFSKHLLKYGGLLFRSFPVQNEDDFSNFISSLNTGKFIDYIGGDSPRNKIKEGIYTSTEAPPSVKIPLHNELSFVKKYPRHIYFYCQRPPEKNGETIIADARKVFQSIDPKVKERFNKKGLKYVSCYYYKSGVMDLLNSWQRSHKSWIDVFETHDKQEVEKKCRENEFEFKWQQNDWIKISQSRPATMQHEITGEDIWFNQAHLYDFNPKLLGPLRYVGAKLFYIRKHMRLHEVFFKDGSRIPKKDLYHILDQLDLNTVYFPWQKNDVLVLDNVLAMHGRATFSGKRRILTAMTG